MKHALKLTIILILICHSPFYSQILLKKHIRTGEENAKGLSLKIKDVNSVEKSGRTSWILKTILTNHSRDTLFYFSFADCESAFYQVSKVYNDIKNYTPNDLASLSIDFGKCGAATQTVIAIPPSGQRTVNLEINYPKPSTSSTKLFVSLSIYRAKNMYERIPHDDLVNKTEKERRISVNSNVIKIKTPITEK